MDRIGEAPEDLTAEEPANKKLSGLGYSARLRNYWDLSEAANLELSASAMTGRKEQPLAFGSRRDINAALARQTTAGVDFTFRWRPLQQGLYKSFIRPGRVHEAVQPAARRHPATVRAPRLRRADPGFLRRLSLRPLPGEPPDLHRAGGTTGCRIPRRTASPSRPAAESSPSSRASSPS